VPAHGITYTDFVKREKAYEEATNNHSEAEAGAHANGRRRNEGGGQTRQGDVAQGRDNVQGQEESETQSRKEEWPTIAQPSKQPKSKHNPIHFQK